MKKRGSGILCHITSLPSPFGIGDLGPGAYAFADFLAASKQSYWQILPLNPTNERYADSPFCSMSSCAGNTVLISPELLASKGLLSQSELLDHPPFSEEKVNYAEASRYKQRLFKRAHARFKQRAANSHDFNRFCNGHRAWLDDHALFIAISEHLSGIPLRDWPKEIGDRSGQEFRNLQQTVADAVEREKFLQFVFFEQWHSLKNYCNGKGIHIIGDFPLFMNYDSVDIWVHPEFFKVDENRKPYVMAGSPPDNFSAEGQLFNCAVYDWDALKKDGFTWWVQRFHYMFNLYDFVRIDHFRGLISYWEVAAGERSGKNGTWKPAAVHDFLNTLLRFFPTLPVIAEDLGTITADIREAMAMYAIPGIKVLLLAFQKGACESVYLPHNHPQNCVAYTGTHDTNTIMGWFGKEDSRDDKVFLSQYLGREIVTEANWELIKLTMMSVAHTAIIQLQDLLGAGEESRMNTPGQAEGNWQWRLPAAQLTRHASRLAQLSVSYDRAL